MQDTTTTGLVPVDYAPAQPAPAVDPLAAKLANWKTQHREVTEIRVQIAEGDEAIGYIHNPDRNIIAYSLTRIMNKQVLEGGEFILRNCWLGGDERLNPDSSAAYDPAVVAAAMQAARSIEMLSATSKKL